MFNVFRIAAFAMKEGLDAAIDPAIAGCRLQGTATSPSSTAKTNRSTRYPGSLAGEKISVSDANLYYITVFLNKQHALEILPKGYATRILDRS